MISESDVTKFHALSVLGYLSDLFTASPRNQFTREEVLQIINAIRSDADLFDPQLVVFHEQINSALTQVGSAR